MTGGALVKHFERQLPFRFSPATVIAIETGRDTPALPPASTLNKREIEAVVDYLLAKVIGRGAEITRTECEEAYGEGARMCGRYPAKP